MEEHSFQNALFVSVFNPWRRICGFAALAEYW